MHTIYISNSLLMKVLREIAMTCGNSLIPRLSLFSGLDVWE